jgi:ABC-type transport system involved in multi-copper enzyme maturation permease subunit
MLKTIIKREILEYLKSAKFLIGLLTAIILTVASTILNVQDYALRHQDYLDAKKEFNSTSFDINVFREPQVLGTLVRGKDRDMGEQLQMTVMNAPSRLSGYLNIDSGLWRNPASSSFTAVDFAFLVRIILSLLVIFLAYNAVSEERTNGTLKLVLANALSRDKLLLGKLLGGLAVVLGSLVIAGLLASLILILHPSVSLSGGDLIRIAAMLAVSALYLSAFFCLGLFVSIKASRPAAALMILLQAWIFLVIIYPNLSVMLAERICKLPSEESIAGQEDAVEQKFHPDIEKSNEAFAKDRSTDKYWLRYNELWSGRAAEMHKIEAELSRRQTVQMNLAEFLSALSPAALFDQVMNRLARTDIREYERFMESAFRLWQKQVERARLQYTDPETFKKTSLPDFSYRSDSLVEALAARWPHVLILFLFNLIFFALAYTEFLKKDVR